MRTLLLLLAAFCLATSALPGPPAAPAELDPLFRKPELWTLKPEDFGSAPEAKAYVWTSAAKDSARAGEREMRLLGLPVFESVARFEGEKLKEITSLFYARGDAGSLSREQFEALIRTAMENITAATRMKATVRGRDASSAVKAEGLLWNTSAMRYLLEYSFTREMKTRDQPFRAEFVRLTVSPAERSVSLLASATSPVRAKFTGAAHVKRDLATGEVLITDVPMVDQGDKGYCAVACTERVLRYYGIPVDTNELAQVANSDADRGTNADTMFEAVKKLGARLKVRVRAVEEFEPRRFMALVRDYNAAARKGNRGRALPEMGNLINVSAVYHAMDPALLQEARTKNKSDLSRFSREVQQYVDAGTPLLWSVFLGMVPEPGIPQGAGGHMRLIVGYNQRTDELIFTDSWGAGHEKKKMPMEAAWTITTGLTAIEPL